MERMCDVAAADDELEFEAVAATAKTAAIKSCRQETTTTATVAAPTPSCSLPPPPPTAAAAPEEEPTTTTLQIKEEIKDEEDDEEKAQEEAQMAAQMKLNEEAKMQGGVEVADEQSERYEEKEQTAATIKRTPPLPPPRATSMSDTTLKTSLPWDFIANDELCRSCGKPHTELYELFENEQQRRRRHSTAQLSGGNNSDDDDESNSRRIVKSNNGNSHSNNNGEDDVEAADVSSIRRDPRAIARAAMATKTTAKQQQKQQQSEEQSHTQATQPNQMDNILQEMQIWHLRIKPNDGLPQRICPKCTAQFYIIGKFRRKCLKVQIRLRSMLREVEQQQQLQQQVFLATATKDARDTRADTSPARQLDIDNELMNKQHNTSVVQPPLSEVELFETNWNVASEATNSGMLIEGEEMLVDEPTINAAGANDDNKDVNDESDNDEDGNDDEENDADADEDEDEEEEDVELTSAMCIDVTPSVVAAVKQLDSRPGCLLSKNTKLASNKHSSSSSSSIVKESQPVSKDSYKTTSHMKRKRTRKLTTAAAAEEAHTRTRSVELLRGNSFVADSTDNQDDYYDPLEEEAMSTSKVEIISIENLKNIEHFTNTSTNTNTTTTAPPPNYKGTTPQRTKTTTTAANKQKSHELTSKSIKKPNKANPQKDCKTTTETQSVTKQQTTNSAAANNTEASLLLHSRDVPTNNVKPHKTTTKTGRIEAESPTAAAAATAALVAHSNSQNVAATRADDNLTPTTLLKLNDEGMKAFVSKAALKEYDSSPSTFAADDDDDCRGGGGDVNVDPQHAPLEQTKPKTADKNDSFDNEHKAMEDNPEEILIIPYAQKRRKKCRRLIQSSKSTDEVDMPEEEEEEEEELLVGLEELSALDKHEITSVNTDTHPMRECSVRLYKLNESSKKSNLITTATVTTTTSTTPMTLMQDPQNSAVTNEIMDNAFENVIDVAAPAVANQQALQHTKEQKPIVAAEPTAVVNEDDDDDDENMPILKKIKLMKAARHEALQLKRRASAHWKTKAEMKALNEDPLSFRKPSLRRQMKLEKYALMSKQLFDTQRAAANIGNQMETDMNLTDAENDANQVENAARKANLRFADEEEAITSEDLIDNIKVETLVEQPTMSLSPPTTTGSSTSTTTKELSKECGDGGGSQKTSPLKMVLRKSRYHEKLRLKRNLRANLLKLRQHNTAMATNLKCKQMQEAKAEGSNGGVSNAPAADAVSITHIGLAAMATEREAMQPPPVAKIDKLLASNFDLATTNEALRESNSMIVMPTDGDKPNAALEAATKITTTATTEEATSGVETSLEQILSQRADEPKLMVVASNNKQGSVHHAASKTSAYGIGGVNEHLQELPVSSAATSSTHANELELAFETFGQQPPPPIQSNQQKSEEQDELIVRVPLAVLTQDFQRMHFTHTDQNVVESGRENATELPCRSSNTPAVAAVTTSWIAPENLQQQSSNDYALATETQTAFTSETIQLHHHHHNHHQLPPATAADDATADFVTNASSKASHETSAACSLNESDQSEFYGFGNDSDPRPTTAYDANDSFIPEKHSTMISSQINDYINEFQTHCLEADEKSPPHFSHDSELLNNDKNATNLQTLQPTRGCSSHLANNGGLVVDNYVDNTLNGLLDEIQEQNLFSPSTTPLVTMESEDFHHHSSYSPLSSESSEQTPRSHHEYMKNSLCDLSPGPTVNPSHIIDATAQNSYANAQLQQQQHQLQQQQQQQQHQHHLLHQQQQLQQQQQHQQQQQQQQQHSYNNYVECFTEDSTQSELIGFQNDIPCFENIELNSSTPRHNSTPPPPPPPQTADTAAVVQQVQLPNTPTRTPNCSLQATADQTPHPGANLKLPHKHIETGNVHYLGLGNETDLCQSLNTDSMGLVCTTGTGVQMHTPTLKSASCQMQEIPYERETISSESSENSREYAVDSATLHFTQIFQDMPLHQQQQQPQEAQQAMPSTLQSCEFRKETSTNVLKTTSSPNVATSKKSAILAKYAASNNASGVTRNLFSKKLEPATLQLPPTPKLQYVTLPPQPQHSTLSLSTDPNSSALNTTQLLAAPHSTLHHHNQEMLNLGPKYTLYTEVLPQDLQWHTTNNMTDQQTTTTYYINAADLNQSNLISTTTIAMQPLIHSHAAAGGAGTGGISLGAPGTDLNTMTNLTLLPTQLSHTGQPTATLMQSHSNSGGSDKRSMDANENYMDNGGMQNQSIMIVFPQEYINDPSAGVSALYNTAAGNQLTLAPLQQTYSTIVPPPPPPPPPPQQQQQQTTQQVQLNNATMMPTTLQSNATPPQTMLNNSATVPVQVSAAAATAAANRAATPTISAPHPSRHAAVSSPLQPAKINLTCRFCHKRPKFTNNLDYSNHIIEMHPGENPFNCPHCPLLFTRRAQRQRHIVEVHGALRFNCAQCGQSFCAQRTLDLHLQRAHVHNDAAGQNKKVAVQLQQQQQQQQQKVDVTASCSQAREGQTAHYEPAAAATSKTTTNWHERLHATTGNSATEQHASLEDVATTPFQAASATDEDDSENSASTADNSQLATESSTVQKPPHRILGCPDCDDSFDDLANQEPHTHQLLHSTHQQLHHSTPQTGNSSSSTSNLCTMPSPEQTEPDSTSTTTLRQFRKQRQLSKSPIEQPERVLRSAHSCVFCEERFTNEVALRKHHQTAHGSQTTLPFVCSMCKRGFRMRTALQRHMETHDSVGRPYECSICLVRFPRPSQLTLHKLTVHFLRKPHACNICGKQFGTESALKTHEKFHGAHIKTHIPLGMCIEEDPPSLQRDREQREQEQLQLAAAESADHLNDAAAFDDMSSPEFHQVQRSS